MWCSGPYTNPVVQNYSRLGKYSVHTCVGWDLLNWHNSRAMAKALASVMTCFQRNQAKGQGDLWKGTKSPYLQNHMKAYGRFFFNCISYKSTHQISAQINCACGSSVAVDILHHGLFCCEFQNRTNDGSSRKSIIKNNSWWKLQDLHEFGEQHNNQISLVKF